MPNPLLHGEINSRPGTKRYDRGLTTVTRYIRVRFLPQAFLIFYPYAVRSATREGRESEREKRSKSAQLPKGIKIQKHITWNSTRLQHCSHREANSTMYNLFKEQAATKPSGGKDGRWVGSDDGKDERPGKKLNPGFKDTKTEKGTLGPRRTE